MAVKKVKQPCPYCGNTEFVRGMYSRKQIFRPKNPLGTYYTVQVQICKRCGSIIREFIANPEQFPDY